MLHRVFLSLFCVLTTLPAVAASPVLMWVDPKSTKNLPVYQMKDGKRVPVYMAAPGEYLSVAGVTSDGWLKVKALDRAGKPIELVINQNGPVKLRQVSADDEARQVTADGLPNEPLFGRASLTQDRISCVIDPAACRPVTQGQKMKVEDATLMMSETDMNQRNGSNFENHYRTSDGREGTDRSWVESYLVSPNDRYFPKEAEDDPNCETSAGVDPMMTATARAITAKGLDGQLETIMANVGECYRDWDGSQFARRGIAAIKQKKLPQITREDGQVATKKDWVAIEAVARTLYAEMASCFDDGAHYPTAVAKVAYNRTEFAKTSKGAMDLFLAGGSLSGEHPMTRAMLKDNQFQVWKEGNKAGRLAMCPPRSADETFYNGNKPGPDELEIWREAVQIASKSVLAPKAFRAENSDLRDLHYTTGMSPDERPLFQLISGASVGGHRLKRSSCVQIWKDTTVPWRMPKEQQLSFFRFNPFSRPFVVSAPVTDVAASLIPGGSR